MKEDETEFDSMSRLRRALPVAPDRVRRIGLRLIAPFFLVQRGDEGVDDGMLEVVHWYLKSTPEEFDLEDLLAIANRLEAPRSIAAITAASAYQHAIKKQQKAKENRRAKI